MRALLLLLVALIIVPRTAGAQVPPGGNAGAFAGQRVVDVQLSTEGRPADEPALLDLVETKVGSPLSLAQVRESITHLFSLGRFQDIQVEAVAANGGVALRYNLIPVQNVSRLEFSGNLGVSERSIRRAVQERFGARPLAGRASDAADFLQHQFYPDRGYLDASVRWTSPVLDDADRNALTFTVDAGARATVREVTVMGEPPDGLVAFRREMEVTTGTAYAPAAIRDRITRYQQKLRRRGRYEARVSVVPEISADRSAVDLRFTVEPGPVVEVTFRGDPLPPDRVKEFVPIEKEGSIDQDLLEDSARRIMEYLNQQGYWKASAEVTREEAPERVTIVFSVRQGLRYFVAPKGVLINGVRQVPMELLRSTLQNLDPGDVYVAANLGAAVRGMSNIYLTRGFASLKIDPAANELNPDAEGRGQVQPVLVITEGPQTFIGSVAFDGNTEFSAQELAGVVKAVAGDVYFEPRIDADREAVLTAYLNAGYDSATVAVKPVVSEDGTRADLRFQITEGPQTIVDHLIIVGNTRTDPRIIERELLIKPGKPFGLEDRLESQRRLQGLGLFRRVRIEPLAHGSPSRRDVLVSVEEAAATTLGYGGGLEVTRRLRGTGPGGEAEEHLEFAPRGFFDIGRRNIGGKNRSVNLYTRLSVRQDNGSESGGSGGLAFSEYRVVGTYREPRALGMSAADLTITGALEQGIRSSFNFARKGVNADIARRLGPRTRVSARYAFGTTRIFDERFAEEDPDQANIDRIFPQVRLSSFAAAISFDTRDDVIDPARGVFLSAESTFASRSLGGQVGFIKSYTQGFWYSTIPGTRRLIVATRAAVGVADGFPRSVTSTGPDGAPRTEIIEDLPASERFFAGGDSTIRGYALDTVGAPNTITAKGFPRGGNAVVIGNVELRVPVWREVGAAFFVDGGNVFNRVSELDFGELRGSYGIGLRYRSPVGPIRFDLGFKMDRREFGGKIEPRRVFHFSIGQAF